MIENSNQQLSSYNHLIPSTDFKGDEYALYLEYASAIELEKDILTENTYVKMMTTLIFDEYSNLSQARMRHYE